MNSFIQKAKAMAFLPLLILAIFIDIAVGDAVTRSKTSIRQKLIEHKSEWLRMYKGVKNHE